MPKLSEIVDGLVIGYKGKVGSKFIWASCENCGKERWVARLGGKPKYPLCHSCACKAYGLKERGEANPAWKGGNYLDPKGYILVKVQPDDRFYSMANMWGYVFEHRLVVAQRLNRCLRREELVHHLNGIKTDNRSENLILINRREHIHQAEPFKRRVLILENQVGHQAIRITLLEAEVTLLRKQLEREAERL